MRREQKSTYRQLLELIQEINGGGIIHRVYEDAPAQSIRVGRRKGEVGLWEGEQRIVSATVSNKECMAVVLEITYLAAGFIVGCKGEAMKQIWKKTGASIRSNAGKKKDQEQIYTARLFSISGTHIQILETVQIFVAAVNRYKELVEGKRADEVVERAQVVEGITFQYCPPPVSAIPYSARTMDFPGKMNDQALQRQEESGDELVQANQQLSSSENTKKEIPKTGSFNQLSAFASTPNIQANIVPKIPTSQNVEYQNIPRPPAFPLPPPPPPPSLKYYPYYTTSMPMTSTYNYYVPAYRYTQLQPYTGPSSTGQAYGIVSLPNQGVQFVKEAPNYGSSPFIQGQHPPIYWGYDQAQGQGQGQYTCFPPSPISQSSSYDFFPPSPTSRTSSYDSLVAPAYMEPSFHSQDFGYNNNIM